MSMSCAYSQNESEWTRYNLEGVALYANVPEYLEPMGAESIYIFQSPEDLEFEVFRIERFYFSPESKANFLKHQSDTSTNYFQIELDTITVNVHAKHLESKEENSSSWAYFSTGNYEYNLAYTGPKPERFIQFINSIEVNYERLNEQYELNKVEPDYSKLKLEFDIDLGGKNYLLNRTKNTCKIAMPETDSVNLYLSCSGCLLKKIKDDEYVIIPSTNADTIKISLQTSLPENRTFTFYEKTISVKQEE